MPPRLGIGADNPVAVAASSAPLPNESLTWPMDMTQHAAYQQDRESALAAGISEESWERLARAAAARGVSPGDLLWQTMAREGYASRLEYAAPLRHVTPRELMWELAAREGVIEHCL